MNRRDFVKGLSAVTAIASIGFLFPSSLKASHHQGFELMNYLENESKSDFDYLEMIKDNITFPLVKDTRGADEWRQILTDDEFYVLREEGTERAFTGPYWDNKADGMYHCRGCDLPLFPSVTKYKSGTGWPSFWAPLDKRLVGIKTDKKFFMTRTEVHCARCKGHLGHVFEDGPQPTGLRYCLNGTALRFEEKV